MYLKMYDLIIIWWWASGLMCSIFAPKNFKKIVIDWNSNFWAKILLSWWERCNFTNMNFDPESCYFWVEKDWLKAIFDSFSNIDMISFLSENSIESVQEDNWRVLLKSWNSKQLLDMLLKRSLDNNSEHILGQNVVDVNLVDWWYEVITEVSKYLSKRIVISTWWRSFPNTWTQGFWYQIASKFWVEMVQPYKWLCSFVTKTDFTDISWITIKSEICLKDWENLVYQDCWNLLFTHFWLSWPVVYNLSLAVWNYLRSKGIDNTQIHNYLREKLVLNVKFIDDIIPKRLKEFFRLYNWKIDIDIKLDDWKSWNEAKVTWWWVKLSELDSSFQSKKIPWLYFIWELVDITWKTWWYNLQFAWSSWYISGKSMLN